MLAAAPAHATGLSSSAKTEIDALLTRLGASECQFNRNGSWYSASKARDHMQTKLNDLIKKGRITSAEDFIEQAASRSSFSGKPYMVLCPSQDEVPSAVWLGDELRKIREGHSQ
jgi:hypothetical protein